MRRYFAAMKRATSERSDGSFVVSGRHNDGFKFAINFDYEPDDEEIAGAIGEAQDDSAFSE